jgi:hypothetical protein
MDNAIEIKMGWELTSLPRDREPGLYTTAQSLRRLARVVCTLVSIVCDGTVTFLH